MRLATSCCIFLWILALLSAQIAVTNARLYLTTKNNTVIKLSTLDYFLYRQPYYHYEGAGVQWSWADNGTSCAFQPAHSSDSQLQTIAKMQSSHPDVGLFVDADEAANAGCQTIAQIGLATTKLSAQFVQSNYPPIKLIVLMKITNDTAPYWGPNSLEYVSYKPTSIPDGPPSIDIAMLDQWASQTFLDAKLTNKSVFHFMAEQEPGPWNQIFLGPKFIGYQWAYFAVISGALLYAWSRVIMLFVLRILPQDIRLIAFIITSIYCLILLFYLTAQTISYKQEIIDAVVYGLSSISLIIIIFRWASHCKNIFSNISLVCFQITIVISIMLAIIIFIMNMIISCGGIELRKYIMASFIGCYIMPFFPLASFINFGGFAIWFGCCAYRMKDYRELRARFIQLTLFSTIASITFIYTMLDNLLLALELKNVQNETITKTALFYIFGHTALLIRALVCLTILGVRWPKLRSRKNTTLEIDINSIQVKSPFTAMPK
ncbi:hypothetical protein BDF19DRAFT_454485 [Syncephalis fuscata]|nr:hypothetical protein BDF19DRAFT_454485 [Syncephalis fuscata]